MLEERSDRNSFLAGDPEQRAAELMARVRRHVEAREGIPERWVAYWARLSRSMERGQTPLLVFHSHLDFIRGLLSMRDDAEGLQILDAIERDC